MPDTFQWRGPQVTQEVYLSVKHELNNLGAFLTTRMKQMAPVRTGYLRSEIQFVHAVQELAITVFIGPFYGIYQEFGTRFIRPHPFVRPALLEAAARWHFSIVDIRLYPAAQRSQPLRAHASGFHLPGKQPLTRKQELHVARHLTPVSKKFARAFRRKKVKFRVRKGK